MQQKRLRDALKSKSGFVVIVELTSGPNFNFAPIEKFLEGHKKAGLSSVPDGFNFVAITSTDNSGGTPNLRPADILAHVRELDLLGDSDFIPHISCKDENADALVSSLAGLKAAGVESLLVITGDKPVKGKRVFELEAVGFLHMIKKMNARAYLKATVETINDIHQFFAGAAVSPFKYTEPSQMQQYYKMEKKIARGAEFLITQVGWDWKKSLELFKYLEENGLDVPVIGNVFFLSTTNPAPTLMHDLKLPGCFVSDELLKKLNSESFDEQIERAAQQVAMYKSIGAAGVDIGSVHDYQLFVQILQRASEIGDDWEQFKANLYWPRKGGFYLYDDTGKCQVLSRPKKKFSQRSFNFMHKAMLDPDYAGFHVFKKVMHCLGADKGENWIYHLFDSIEKAIKSLLFKCESCGDCYLYENFGLCTIGRCAKGLDNVPCGDATVDGYCGNDLDLVCIGELTYSAATAETGGIEQWRTRINKPRIHSLEQTSSILNYLFARDHTEKSPLMAVGELINASIPKTGKIIKQLHDSGAEAYSKPSGALNYVKAMIESQADNDAAYIAVNLDAFSNEDGRLAAEMMAEYVKLVRKWGKGVPVCIDSNDSNVIIAGLKEWHNTSQAIKPPLLSSIKLETIDEILALKKNYDYKFAVLLGKGQFTNNSETDLIKQSHLLARQTFIKAVEKHGFKPDEIFFELVVYPLASDIPQADDMQGHTYITFEIAKKIKQDRQIAGVHCLMRPSVVGRKLPRSVGICRAYIGKALEYGFDAAFVNVAHRFGMVEPDPELLKLVDAYAKLDGSVESKEKAAILIDEFCKRNQKVEAKLYNDVLKCFRESNISN
jgi:methylenetetrahydrofolate reductase (NADPH)